MAKRGKKGNNILLIFGGLLAVLYLTSQAEASPQKENLTSGNPTPTPEPNKIPARQQPQAQSNQRDFIIKVQRFLNANGYKISVTGFWNAQTNNAQLAYMKKRGIKTSATFRKLVESWKPKTR